MIPWAAESGKTDEPASLPHSRGAHAVGSIGAEVFAIGVVAGGFRLKRHPAERVDSEGERVQPMVARAANIDDLVTHPQDGVLEAVRCDRQPRDNTRVIQSSGLAETAAG